MWGFVNVKHNLPQELVGKYQKDAQDEKIGRVLSYVDNKGKLVSAAGAVAMGSVYGNKYRFPRQGEKFEADCDAIGEVAYSLGKTVLESINAGGIRSD